MLNRGEGSQWDLEKLEDYFQQIPAIMNEFVVENDDFVYREVALNSDLRRTLLEGQANKEFYIPTYEEITEFAQQGYFASEPYTMKLIEFLRHNCQETFSAAEVKNVVWQIQIDISMGCEMQDVMRTLDFVGVYLSDRNYDKMMDIVNNLWNHTRMVYNRGFTPRELSSGYIPVPVVRSGRKIGRNEPCPCGSGKKYKNCCGKMN